MNKLLFMTSKKILLLLSILFLWTCGGGGSKAPTEPVEPAPISNFTATPTSGLQPLEVVFTSTATGTIASYAWNVDADTEIEGTAATFTHTYTDAGTYGVTLTVTGPGGSNPKTVADMITVTSAAPTPTTATTQTTQEDGSTTISLTATDPNGQAVTFAITTDPTSGTATLSGTDITYTPNANFYGTDSFDYTASNGTYTSDPVTITITVEGEDDEPTTNDVSATTDEDTAVTVDLDATEIDGDNYSFTIVSQPTNGTLGSVNGNQVEYTPNENFNGTDTFTFEATDDRTSRRNVATATITVNAVNDAPIAEDIDWTTTYQFETIEIDLIATDIDDDQLSFQLQLSPLKGESSIIGNVLTYYAFGWGQDSLKVKAYDGSDYSNEATIKLDIGGNPTTFDLHRYGYGLDKTSDGGFIIAGGFNRAALVKADQNGKEEWIQYLDAGSYLFSVKETSDGGYIAGGNSDIVKTDSNGNQQWKVNGPSNSYGIYDVMELSNGDYIIIGDSAFGKIDSNGNWLWQNSIGGNEFDLTSDEGFIIVKTSNNDISLTKTDPQGNEIWSKTYGGSQEETGTTVRSTSDGGYIVGGTTRSYACSGTDGYLVKVDSSGNEEWNNNFGCTGKEEINSIKETSDGGYILGGSTRAMPYSGLNGSNAYLIKIDSSGSTEWSGIYGYGGSEDIVEVVQTDDGGFAAVGNIHYTKEDGRGDRIYLIKTDSNGVQEF